MSYNNSGPCLLYYRYLAYYDLNKYWKPAIGHQAIKVNKGDYNTEKSVIIALNESDLVFLNHRKIKHEYRWIPTLQDLICLAIDLKCEKDKTLIRKDKDGITYSHWITNYHKMARQMLLEAVTAFNDIPEIGFLKYMDNTDLIDKLVKYDDSFLQEINQKIRMDRSEYFQHFLREEGLAKNTRVDALVGFADE